MGKLSALLASSQLTECLIIHMVTAIGNALTVLKDLPMNTSIKFTYPLVYCYMGQDMAYYYYISNKMMSYTNTPVRRFILISLSQICHSFVPTFSHSTMLYCNISPYAFPALCGKFIVFCMGGSKGSTAL